MNPVLVLTDPKLTVEPGAEARTTVKIRNAGARVEEYVLQVLGPAAGWAEVVPPTVSVYPGTDVEVSVLFRPPRGPATPAGAVAFGVLCRSQEDPDSSAVAEGELAVGAVLELAGHLTPAESKGRWQGKHRVEIENNGSAPLRVKVTATDPANALSFAVAPEVIEVAPGSRASGFLKIRTREPFLRGTPTQRRFQVSYSRLLSSPGEPAAPGQLDGTFLQKPVLSKAVFTLGALALAGLIAVVAVALLGGKDEEKAGGALPVDAPKIRTVEPAADRVQVVWDPNPNATGYAVQLVSAPDPNGASPVDVLDEKEPKPGQNAYSWQELDPNTPYCFRLVALNGKLRSEPSKPECTKTPAKAAVPPPAGLTALPVGDELRVKLAWKAGDPTAESFVLIDGVKMASPIAAGVNEATVPVTSAGTYCFSLVSKVGDAETAPASEVCVPVGPAATAAGAANPGGAGGATGTGGGSGTTPTTVASKVQVTGWVVVLRVVLVQDVLIDQQLANAQEFRAALETSGVPARIALNSQIGLLAPDGAPAWYVFVDGFTDEAAATKFCTDKKIAECGPQLPKQP